LRWFRLGLGGVSLRIPTGNVWKVGKDAEYSSGPAETEAPCGENE